MRIAWVFALVFIVFSVCYTAYADSGPSVETGKKLFYGTFLGTNGKSCGSCHKTTENIKKDTAKYPEDPALKNVINGCITENLKGKPLPGDSAEMNSLIMYMRSVK